MTTLNAMQVAEEALLTPTGLSSNDLNQVFSQLHDVHLDAADLYFQSVRHEMWALEDGLIKEASFNTDRGVGVRAVVGEKTGFAHADEISLAALQRATQAARSIAKQGQHKSIATWQKKTHEALYLPVDPLHSLAPDDKVDLLKRMDVLARSLDPCVKEVNVSLSGVYEVVLVVDTLGTFAADVRPLVRMGVQVMVERNGRRETGWSGGGGRMDYSYFMQEERAEGYVREAVRQALVNLESIPAPAGVMPVVLGPGWPAVLLHEAIGHGLEGDFNRKGTSAFSGRIGERVASPLCTIVDDGTLKNRRGSLSMDDEGVPTQCTMLIEKGILKGYLQDKLNARLMKSVSTGNGRRESYAHTPMPRMTNTYMLAGEQDPQEIIRSVKKGIYAVNFGGGQVDITNGKFVFSATEAYLIEDGKITVPVKGATLIGSGPEVLTKVSMVGNDLKLDSGVGVCGKDGQSVPVGVGQPTLKVDEIIVGGTEHA